MEQRIIERDRQIELLKRVLGDVFLSYLFNDTVIEIMLNSDGKLWIDELGKGMQEVGYINSSKSIVAINTVASMLNKTINYDNPILEGEFPIDNSRFAAQIPPVVANPTFSIRKKAKLIFTLEDYMKQNIISNSNMEFIKKAIANHENIIIIGGTSSGKTTFTNACIDYMSKICNEERIIIIEDTNEIQCSSVNSILYHTSISCSITDLLKTTLRMRPDRIIIGEVRDYTALDLLDAWSTGHSGGISTIHANNARQALERLENLVSRHPFCPKDIKPIIANAVDVIVSIKKINKDRKIDEIIKVHNYDSLNNNYEFEYIK